MKQLNLLYVGGGSSVPNGQTVTPINDVEIWQKCAGLPATYTTLSDILNDHSVSLQLIANKNATDYLVRSTSFAASIVADESAMIFIGACNYASDTLLVNNTWFTAIDGSTYKDYVINASVPSMTSDTAPSGIASASHNSANAWRAFDGNPNGSTQWQGDVYVNSGQVANVDGYVQYAFPYSVCLKKVSVGFYLAYAGEQITNAKIEASNDGVTFNTIKTIGAIDSTSTGELGPWQDYTLVENTDKYTYFRLKGTWYHPSSAGVAYRPSLPGLQFYGRKDV